MTQVTAGGGAHPAARLDGLAARQARVPPGRSRGGAERLKLVGLPARDREAVGSTVAAR